MSSTPAPAPTSVSGLDRIALDLIEAHWRTIDSDRYDVVQSVESLLQELRQLNSPEAFRSLSANRAVCQRLAGATEIVPELHEQRNEQPLLLLARSIAIWDGNRERVAYRSVQQLNKGQILIDAADEPCLITDVSPYATICVDFVLTPLSTGEPEQFTRPWDARFDIAVPPVLQRFTCSIETVATGEPRHPTTRVERRRYRLNDKAVYVVGSLDDSAISVTNAAEAVFAHCTADATRRFPEKEAVVYTYSPRLGNEPFQRLELDGAGRARFSEAKSDDVIVRTQDVTLAAGPPAGLYTFRNINPDPTLAPSL